MELITGVRPMIRKDIEEVARLGWVYFLKYWFGDLIRSGLDSRLGTYFVYQDHDRILGYSIVRVLAGEGEIQRIVAYPSYRRQGIARKFMDAMVPFPKTGSVRAATLEIWKNNRGAKKLYEFYGFRQEAVRKGYYHNPQEDAVIMWNREI